MRRVLRWSAAVVLMATGTLLLFLPGPGIPLIAFAIVLITPELRAFRDARAARAARAAA